MRGWRLLVVVLLPPPLLLLQVAHLRKQRHPCPTWPHQTFPHLAAQARVKPQEGEVGCAVPPPPRLASPCRAGSAGEDLRPPRACPSGPPLPTVLRHLTINIQFKGCVAWMRAVSHG